MQGHERGLENTPDDELKQVSELVGLALKAGRDAGAHKQTK